MSDIVLMLTTGPTGNVLPIYRNIKFKKIFSPDLQSFFSHSELNLEKFRPKYPIFVRSKIQNQIFKQNY